MASEVFFKVNTSSVISEIIDGEAVLVNLDNGIYYSMDNVGADVWSFIEHGLSTNQIVELIVNRYEGDQSEIETGVRLLLDDLQSENLIAAQENYEPDKSNMETLNQLPDNTDRVRYITPVLNKYTDMEDLLLLDPIHEVDDTGWPNPQDGAN